MPLDLSKASCLSMFFNISFNNSDVMLPFSEQQQKVGICLPSNSHSGPRGYHFPPHVFFNIIVMRCPWTEGIQTHYPCQIQVLCSKNNCAHHWLARGSHEAEDSEVAILGGRMDLQLQFCWHQELLSSTNNNLQWCRSMNWFFC